MTHFNRGRASLLAVAFMVLLTLAAKGQSQASTLRGTWAASVGNAQTYRGTWTAQAATTPDTMQGTWTVVNDANQTVLGGTWSALKTARVWSGSWQARIVSRENPQGRIISGTWRTESARPDTKTFADLLKQSQQDQISGRWTSGGRSGGWSVRGSS